MEDDMGDFRSNVYSFEGFDDELNDIKRQMKPLRDRMKELNRQRSELQGNICEFMCRNEIDTCNTKQGTILYKESTTKKPLLINDVKGNIMRYFHELPLDFNDMTAAQRGEDCVRYIYDKNRELVVKGTLKRT